MTELSARAIHTDGSLSNLTKKLETLEHELNVVRKEQIDKGIREVSSAKKVQEKNKKKSKRGREDAKE